jgi:hypothetical protein
MSTAVLLSGHMRSFAACLGSQLWQVYRHYPDCHFFVSTVQDEQATTVDLLIRTVGADRVTFEIVPEQPELALPAGCPPESSWRPERTFMHEPYAMSVPPQAVLRQLWQMHRVWQLAARTAPVFDTYIRCRPDLFFNGFRQPYCAPFQTVALTPWWGRYGGLNDRFAILGRDAAAAYFTTFAQLPEMIAEGCPLHPETLIAYALERNKCENSDSLRAEFCTLRLNGESREPEISGIDLAHAALGAV